MISVSSDGLGIGNIAPLDRHVDGLALGEPARDASNLSPSAATSGSIERCTFRIGDGDENAGHDPIFYGLFHEQALKDNTIEPFVIQRHVG